MKIVLTGSSSGIGQFLAESLAKHGHEICRLARSPQAGLQFSMRCFRLERRAKLRRKNFRKMGKRGCA